MSYNVDELFEFHKVYDGYAVVGYFKSYDPTVTAIEILAEYNGEPVTAIKEYGFFRSKFLKRVVIPPSVREIDVGAFFGCGLLESVEFSEGLEFIAFDAFAETGLKSVRLPKSITELGETAFRGCPELERVEFNSSPAIGSSNFSGCPKLPPETVVMGLICSTDITRPISQNDMEIIRRSPRLPCELFRPDVFELLTKNNCFRKCGPQPVLEGMISRNKPELFPLAEQYGMLEDAGLVDGLIAYAAEHQRVECTAYLLELKKRKYGFEGGSGLEL